MTSREEHLAMLQSVDSVRAAVCDLNGVWRGKLLPAAQAHKLLDNGMRMPLSATTVDIWGTDIEGSPLLFESGDADGICLPTGRGVLPIDWLERPSCLLPLWMVQEDGLPSPVCPRQILGRAARALTDEGLTPVVALELEFYLLDRNEGRPLAPVSPVSNRRLMGDSVLSVDDLEHFDGFFADVYAACVRHDIPADGTISENSAGQFEINFKHVPDPLKAADDAVLFKRIVKGIARQHNMAATFMAKPYGDQAGSGMHAHVSMMDRDGNNVFDDGSTDGSENLLHALGGLMDRMAPSALIFAPHLNSFRRLAPGTHAPTGIGWGYENRSVALRVPGGDSTSRRIEHRVAGADANPYLVLAAVLTGILHGLHNRIDPGDPVEGDAYNANLRQLPEDWHDSIVSFRDDPLNAVLFPPLFRQIFAAQKWQERNRFIARISDFELTTYLASV